jgi:hypothetical protein
MSFIDPGPKTKNPFSMPPSGFRSKSALAAFVERPQADCSNRRYDYSIKPPDLAVNSSNFPFMADMETFVLNPSRLTARLFLRGP